MLGARSLADKLQWVTLGALALWAAAPIAYLLLRAWAHNESLSGGDSLFAADQLQYLAWIRSSGEHVLATNGFDLQAGGHVFLHPMFLLSGLLWRAGVGIALSCLLWMPVAVAVLFFGFRQYTRRMLHSPLAQVATLVLALFFVTPADPLVGWTVGSNGLGTLAGELGPSGSLYGYFPIAITIGLMPLFVLGLEQIAEPARRLPGRSRGWYVASTAAGGVIISWLHPWQGATLLLLIGAVLVLAGFKKSHWTLLIPAVATGVPLVYYFALSRFDAAWGIAQNQSPPGRPSVFLLVLALAPFLAVAAAGVSRWPATMSERTVLLWPASALVVYFVSPEYAPHALEGLSLPLGVLAVRGWQRMRVAPWLAVVAISLSTIPGLIFTVRAFREVALADSQGLLLNRGETRALAYLARAPAPGGVLPSLRISAAVPAYTGRRTWIGHATWTRDYASRARAVMVLFSGRLSAVSGRRFLRQVGARYILADCEPGFAPSWLGPLLRNEHRFGCVTVYELNIPAKSATL